MLAAAEFDKIVEAALRRNVPRFRRQMKNVAIVVEPEPPHPSLLGLYQGRPLTHRSVFETFAMPDKITIYQGPHERLAESREQLEQMVADTVWHEIAHHFGFSDAEIAAIEEEMH